MITHIEPVLCSGYNKMRENMREGSERKRKAGRTVGEVWQEKLTTNFIEGISGDCKEMDLWKTFSPFGVLMDVYILRR